MTGYMTGSGTTPGMWEMVSEALHNEKLPESVNAAIYALKDGEAVVIPKKLVMELLESVQGWNGKLHFDLASHVRGNREPPNSL